jgi:hypothetical protein
MDRSIPPLPHPIATSAYAERRRSVRQKLHTPVYASFNGPQTGMVVDLSELLDLHEDGFAIQTGERLEMNRAVTLCLDLPETRNYIHGVGQVVWSDDTGRGGIQFSALSDSSRKILKEWLFANLLIACSNHAARTEQRAARHEQEQANEKNTATQTPALHESTPMVPVADERGPQDFSDLERDLKIVRGKIQNLGDDVDAVLQLITASAASLTHSSGAAMAFLANHVEMDAFVRPGERSSPISAVREEVAHATMICRARSGEPAPPLGARLDTQHGISGECVRTGRLVACENAENDQRVDADLCRSLGIGSLMAAPIVSDLQGIGVLEVLSPYLRDFTEAQRMALDELVGMVPKLYNQSAKPETVHSETPGKQEVPVVTRSSVSAQDSTPQAGLENEIQNQIEDQVAQQVSEENLDLAASPSAPQRPNRLLYRALLGLSLVVALIALAYVFGSPVKKWAESSPETRWSFMKPVKAVNAAEESAASAQSTSLRSAASTSVDPNSVGGSSAVPMSADPSADQARQPQSLEDVQKLAAAGDADAQWQMGVRYHDGQGVPQDDVQAVQWFRRAAEQGSVVAQGALGAYYWRGRGVPADLSKAYFWSAIAMAQGDEMSKSRIEGLSSQMTRAQISVARQQAEDWIRSHTRPTPSKSN